MKAPLANSAAKLEYITDRLHLNSLTFLTLKIPYKFNMIPSNPLSFTPPGSAVYSLHLVSIGM